MSHVFGRSAAIPENLKAAKDPKTKDAVLKLLNPDSE